MVGITKMEAGYWPDVRRIYQEGINTGQATFETSCPEWKEWDSAHTPDCRLVAVRNEEVVGWAALTPVSGRCVYAGVAEVSVYIAESARARGIGKQLLNALITESEKCGYWTLQASVFATNTVSISLHEAAGFRLIGTRERIGQRNGVWLDTVIMERRSTTVGIN